MRSDHYSLQCTVQCTTYRKAVYQAFYTIHTYWVVKFITSTAVPVCCIAIVYNTMLLAVEYMKI